MDRNILNTYMRQFGIALTGGVATGKSTIAAIVRELGYVVIDADQLARVVVNPGSPILNKIQKKFGKGLVNENGELDRRQLREIIARDPNTKNQLEQLLHPAITEELYREIDSLYAKSPRRYWFYEAALVIETKSYDRFSAVWLADCSPQKQLERLLSRDGQALENARALIQSQASQESKKNFATVVINTDCPLNQLKQVIKELIDQLPNPC